MGGFTNKTWWLKKQTWWVLQETCWFRQHIIAHLVISATTQAPKQQNCRSQPKWGFNKIKLDWPTRMWDSKYDLQQVIEHWFSWAETLLKFLLLNVPYTLIQIHKAGNKITLDDTTEWSRWYITNMNTEVWKETTAACHPRDKPSRTSAMTWRCWMSFVLCFLLQRKPLDMDKIS